MFDEFLFLKFVCPHSIAVKNQKLLKTSVLGMKLTFWLVVFIHPWPERKEKTPCWQFTKYFWKCFPHNLWISPVKIHPGGQRRYYNVVLPFWRRNNVQTTSF